MNSTLKHLKTWKKWNFANFGLKLSLSEEFVASGLALKKSADLYKKNTQNGELELSTRAKERLLQRLLRGEKAEG